MCLPSKLLALVIARKEMLQDIAALTGGQVISEETGRRLDSATLNDLGRAVVLCLLGIIRPC